MLKVHGRSSNDKVVIKLNKRGQPIGDKKPRRELSNFLGTLVKDHDVLETVLLNRKRTITVLIYLDSSTEIKIIFSQILNS